MNDRSAPGRSAPPGSVLASIPLPVRMLVYGVGFLGLVLVALPWVSYQIDRHVPAVHVEIGPFRVVGVVLFAVSFVLYLAASYVLTERGKGAYVEFDPPTMLVVTGPYRYVRNPVVILLLGAMLGEAVALSSTGILLMVSLIALLSHRQVTRLEEPLLRQRYGRAYVEYCANVPRWIPRGRPWTAP